jgi:hypothetical protein
LAISPQSPNYEDLLAYLSDKVTPEAILAFTVSEAAQERADELLERNNEGTLTAEEAAELDQMLQADRLVSVLKARAISRLA